MNAFVRAITLSQYPLLWMRCNKAQWLKNLSAIGAIALFGMLDLIG
ncbi:hypothetical protein [Nostoc sp.]